MRGALCLRSISKVNHRKVRRRVRMIGEALYVDAARAWEYRKRLSLVWRSRGGTSMKTGTIIFLALCASLACQPANAASAIVYGQKTIAFASHPSEKDAIRQAFEKCSRQDAYCTLLLSCQESGFGHVATSIAGETLEAIGGACGAESDIGAKGTAMSFCTRTARSGDCKTRAQWADR